MPRQREVKPWTIYPPTQEDRDIIEQKAAQASLSVSAYLCMIGKLACITVSLPTEQPILFEQAPVQEVVPEVAAKISYEYYDIFGKPLSPNDIESINRERENGGKIELQSSTLGKDGSKRERYKFERNGFLFTLITKPSH